MRCVKMRAIYITAVIIIVAIVHELEAFTVQKSVSSTSPFTHRRSVTTTRFTKSGKIRSFLRPSSYDETKDRMSFPVDEDDLPTTRMTFIRKRKGVCWRLSHVLRRFGVALSKTTRRFATILSLAAFMCLLSAVPPQHAAAASGSGGRMGGSFNRSSSSSSSAGRSYSSPRPSYSRSYGTRSPYSRGSSSHLFHSPSNHVILSSPIILGTQRAPYVLTSPSPVSILSNIAVVGAVVYISLKINKRSASGGGWGNDDTVTSALGTGVSVLSLSFALDVPNRDDPRSLLKRLKRLSETAQTDSRMGVQSLVSDVCLELLRQQSSIFAAKSSYEHFKRVSEADREFSKLALKGRSKFEKETVNKFGGVDLGDSNKNSYLSNKQDKSISATSAVVTVLVAIEGDQTKPRQIRSWQDIWDSLSRVSSDVKVQDCLLSAEILWTPEERGDVLTRKDIAADYPDLRLI